MKPHHTARPAAALARPGAMGGSVCCVQGNGDDGSASHAPDGASSSPGRVTADASVPATAPATASVITQPKASHIANQAAKLCADALVRARSGHAPDAAPVTTSACYATITMGQASWLHALFQYDAASASMQPVAGATGASVGWRSSGYQQMGRWFNALMADTFA